MILRRSPLVRLSDSRSLLSLTRRSSLASRQCIFRHWQCRKASSYPPLKENEQSHRGALDQQSSPKNGSSVPAEIVRPEFARRDDSKGKDASTPGLPLSEQTVSNKEQRKADWAIMKEMARYLWPKVRRWAATHGNMSLMDKVERYLGKRESRDRSRSTCRLKGTVLKAHERGVQRWLRCPRF